MFIARCEYKLVITEIGCCGRTIESGWPDQHLGRAFHIHVSSNSKFETWIASQNHCRISTMSMLWVLPKFRP